jgi:hypothetical protein
VTFPEATRIKASKRYSFPIRILAPSLKQRTPDMAIA